MKKALCTGLLLALLPAFGLSALAQTGAFARTGFGARGVALGNALVADRFTDESPYYNPAHTPQVDRQYLEGGVVAMPLDRQLQFLQFSGPLRPRAGIAVGLIHAGVTNIDGRDRSGYHTQDYGTDEYAGFVAFGTRVSERVSLGVALQAFRADYTDQMTPESSLGLDAGLSVQVNPRLALGFAVEDLLAQYEWDTSEIYGDDGRLSTDRFPVRFRAGFASRLFRDRARWYGEAQAMFYDGTSLALRSGFEYFPVEVLTLRAGVDGLGQPDQHFSAGFGIRQPVGNLLMRAEYAFVPEPYNAGARHYLTVRFYL